MSSQAVATLLGVQTWDPRVPLWRLWNYPAWAVSCEMLFYLVFPSMVPALKRGCEGLVRLRGAERAAWPVFGSAVALAVGLEFGVWTGLQGLLISAGVAAPLAGDVVYTFPLVRGLEFVQGALLGLWVAHRAASAVSRGDDEHAVSAAVCRYGVASDVSFALVVGLTVAAPTTLAIPSVVALVSLPTACFVLTCAHDAGVVASLFRAPFLIHVGEWSYCTYLAQAPVMTYLLWYLNPRSIDSISEMILDRAIGVQQPDAPILPLWTYPLVILFVHLLGWFLFTFVEGPALKWLSSKL